MKTKLSILRTLLLTVMFISPLAMASSVHDSSEKLKKFFTNSHSSKASPSFRENTYKPQWGLDKQKWSPLFSEKRLLKFKDNKFSSLPCVVNKNCMPIHTLTEKFNSHTKHFEGCGHINAEVPLPAAVWLFGSGLVALGFVGTRKREA